MLVFHYGDIAAVYRCRGIYTTAPGTSICHANLRRQIMTQTRSDNSLPEIRKTLVLVGLMGAGKSCIGRRLATRLDLPFIDADREIEEAAGCSVSEIFQRHGEQAFRDGERRVILRLLEGPVCVLATGGGAFMDPRTREAVRERGISIWLRADLELLSRRVSRRNDRPLLQVDNPHRKLEELMAQRHPVYAEADVTVDSQDGPPDATLERVMIALAGFLAAGGGKAGDTADARPVGEPAAP